MHNVRVFSPRAALFWGLLMALWFASSQARAEGPPGSHPPASDPPSAGSTPLGGGNSPVGASAVAGEPLESPKESAVRGYLKVLGGVQYLGPHAIAQRNDLLVETSPQWGLGPSTSVAAGLLFSRLMVGLRGTVSVLPRYWYQSINAELGPHWSVGNLETYVLFGVGVSWVSHIKGKEYHYPGASGVSDTQLTGSVVSGVNARLAGGLSYLLFRHLAVGALLSVEAVHLSRDALRSTEVDDGGNGFPQILGPNSASPYDEASAIGLGVNGSVVLELRL
jgi:hypothetical protein